VWEFLHARQFLVARWFGSTIATPRESPEHPAPGSFVVLRIPLPVEACLTGHVGEASIPLTWARGAPWTTQRPATSERVMSEFAPLPSSTLPSGLRSRFVEEVNGLRMHILEAGFEAVGRPLVLLLHGFPELAYSWRRVMRPLAASGFHVVAPDQRGYGRTTGWDGSYDGDLSPFRTFN